MHVNLLVINISKGYLYFESPRPPLITTVTVKRHIIFVEEAICFVILVSHSYKVLPECTIFFSTCGFSRGSGDGGELVNV